MNRKELYDEVKALNLQEEIRAKYRKNYTNCTNEELQSIIDEINNSISVVDITECPLYKLVEILAKKNILLQSEVDAIMND